MGWNSIQFAKMSASRHPAAGAKAKACGLFIVWLLAGVPGAGAAARPDGRGPEHGSDRTYFVRRFPSGVIELDGQANEPAWSQAAVEKHFIFPWQRATAAETEFRALWDSANVFFSFRVYDSDIVVLNELRDKMDAVFEDRVEVYLGRDEGMKEYFCFEIDARGRVLDYRTEIPKQFDFKWRFPELEARASLFPGGYEVEGRIPLTSLEKIGLGPITGGRKLRCGLHRAESSHDRSGRLADQRETGHWLGRKIEGLMPIKAWISWVDPETSEPDFHAPAAFGWMEFQP